MKGPFQIVGIVALTLLGPHRSLGNCVDYGDYLKWVGGVPTPNIANDVAVSGTYAYVAGYLGTMTVVDVADPLRPAIVSNLDNGGGVTRIAVKGNYAYLVDQHPGTLRIVDIGDPANPTPEGSVSWQGEANAVAVQEGYAYVEGSELQVIDVGNSQAPVIVATLDTPGVCQSITVLGDYAYVAGGDDGSLLVVNISDPTAPRLIGCVTPGGYVCSVAVSGAYVYLGGNRLHVIDVSNPATPLLVGSADLPPEHSSYIRGIAVGTGGLLYLAASQAGFHVVNVSNPTRPTIDGTANVAGNGVALLGTFAFVADNDFGLSVLDVSGAKTVPRLGGLFEVGGAGGFAVRGNRAYIATQALLVADVADPSNPRTLYWVDTPSRAVSVALSGGYALVACGNAGLVVIGIVVEAAGLNRIVGQVAIPGGAGCTLARGARAYVGTSAGLKVLDISDPRHPRIVGGVSTDGPVVAAAISGSYVFAGMAVGAWPNDHGEMQVIDVTDSEHPCIVASLSTPGCVRGVAVAGAYAYLADYAAGLIAVEVTDPSQPQIAGTLYMHRPLCVAVFGDLAYVGEDGNWCGMGALHAVDVSTPRRPRILGNRWIPTWAVSVVPSAGAVFVGGASPILNILPACCSAQPRTARAGLTMSSGLRLMPNPTFRGTAVCLDNPGRGRIRAEIFDVMGRRVRGLLDAVAEGHPCDFVWDGRDDAGRLTARGVYQVRVRTEAGESTARLTVLR